MLAQIGGLIECQHDIAFDDKAIEILVEQRLHCFREVPHDLGLQILDFIENRQCPVLKDRVGIYS